MMWISMSWQQMISLLPSLWLRPKFYLITARFQFLANRWVIPDRSITTWYMLQFHKILIHTHKFLLHTLCQKFCLKKQSIRPWVYREAIPSTGTGALPRDNAGGLPSPRPPNSSLQWQYISPPLSCWSYVMFDDFLNQLVSGSLPS